MQESFLFVCAAVELEVIIFVLLVSFVPIQEVDSCQLKIVFEHV